MCLESQQASAPDRTPFLRRIDLRGGVIGVDGHALCQNRLDPVFRPTYCDSLRGIVSSELGNELGKRDPVRRFQRESVLCRKGHAQPDREGYHKDHKRRNALTLPFALPLDYLLWQGRPAGGLEPDEAGGSNP
jgi:hypothetical protein